MQLFALDRGRELGESVARALGMELSPHEEREFEDGEHKGRPLVSVRERDVYVIHSLYGEPAMGPDAKLVRLAWFCGALRDAAAARVTAVVPYLCYARKERRTKARDPVSSRYVASLFEAVGVDRVVAVDVHELAAFENAFRRTRPEHLVARPLFVQHALALPRPLTVASPDVGGVKRAQRFGEALSEALGEPVPLAFMEKRRSGGVVSGEHLVGEVRDRTVVLVDDLVASGGTLARAAAACRDQGARGVHAVVTHGLFVGDAGRKLTSAPLDELVVTDSIPPFRLDDEARRRIRVLPLGPLLGEAIRRMHEGGSLTELLGGP